VEGALMAKNPLFSTYRQGENRGHRIDAGRLRAHRLTLL
jgi:hypothetical protein